MGRYTQPRAKGCDGSLGDWGPADLFLLCRGIQVSARTRLAPGRTGGLDGVAYVLAPATLWIGLSASKRESMLETSDRRGPAPHRQIVRGVVASRFPWLFGLAGDNGDGYPAYVHAARTARMDPNDWEERELGWLPALPILEELVYPVVRRDFVICEVGTGTGRWSRHLASLFPEGELVLVDRSRWVINFLKGYFAGQAHVRAIRGNGASLPFHRGNWADVVFSQGLFITLTLGHCARYVSEFARVLKPGGLAVFDFIDPETAAGWEFLEREAERASDMFAYHTRPVMTHVLNDHGLEVERAEVFGKSTYVVCRKQ